MTAPATSGDRLEWANTLRGLAALLVVIAHLGAAFFVGFFGPALGYPVNDTLPDWPPGQWLLSLPFDLGGFGVSLFFLLSGLVITKSLHKYSRSGFAAARALRILPTFAAVYLFIVVAVALANNANGMPYAVDAREAAVGMVPGLPTVTRTPSLGLGVEWTLIIELLFYAACLIPFRRLQTERRWVPLMAVTSAVVLVVLFSWTSLAGSLLSGPRLLLMMFCLYLPILLIGVTAAGGLGRRNVIQIVGLAGLYLVGSFFADPPIPMEARFSVLLAVPVFIAACVFGGRWNGHAATSFLADISYPLYLLHILLGSIVMYALASQNLPALVVLAGGLSAVAATAWVFHVAIEVPTHRWGQRLARSRFPAHTENQGDHENPSDVTVTGSDP